ncbi:sigma-70 family RNA polymerase sigma factor [Cellulomonas sp. ACRRI]|uniref:sigma-70 family RNA polymerase sigma factor n=1 Tax=Cellulomonas sp. ACRRI TaxID=2918188 RepID=UPI001EF3B486|nr:sigma-70 family RNA polymerase sigma factor [Cellulomonas sp. ACRRI]MCG7286964.1 sigma-70 family RNA polymerase sigma factor [Cellulomonas sp. ACRRI]
MTWQDDLAAFARERGPALVGYARLLTGDTAAAEDLVQEAVVRVWSRRRAGADITWLEAYVRRAVLNGWVDQCRRDRAWRDHAHLLIDAVPVPSPEHAAVDRARVAAALERLSPRERACTVLRHYDDLTIPEIARRLDLSDGAVKRYLSDAARRLSGLLGLPDDLDTEDLSTTNGGRR